MTTSPPTSEPTGQTTHEPDRESIGAFVRRRRKERGLSRGKLAELAGVGLRFVAELENDKSTVRLDAVTKVLAVFGKELGLRDAARLELGDELGARP